MAAQAQKGTSKTEVYKELFKKCDKNGDGSLSIVELREMLKKGGCNMSDRQVANVFMFFDGDTGDRKITFEEFTAGLDKILEFRDKMQQLFNQLDADKSGFLDRQELKTLLEMAGWDATEDEVMEILKRADRNGDNKISFEEFINACC